MPRDAPPNAAAPTSGLATARAASASLHPLHRLWRLLPAPARRRLLSHGTALLAPRPDWPAPPVRGGVAVLGEVARASGLGEGARLMARALDGLGVPTWLVDAGVGVPGERDSVSRGAEPPPPPGAALVLHVNAPLLPAAMLRLGRTAVRGRRVVGFWAWELPVMPATWRPGLRFVHEVWVPSRFVADAVIGLVGHERPGPAVRVVPHPVAAAPPVPSRLDRAAFGLPPGAVITLVSFNLASSMARKNPLGAIAAFRQAFGDRTDRLLVLKLGHCEHHQADLAAIAGAVAGAANIRIETRTLPAADAHALTACSDIVLSLHRSEGFGLVPAEAMLLGKPVVATGWSGNMDFMDAGTAALVDYALIPAIDPRGTYAAAGARWAEPDLRCAAAHLLRLADDTAGRIGLGETGRAAARARLGAERLADAVTGLGYDLATPARS